MKLCFCGDVTNCMEGIEILSKDFDFIPSFCDCNCDATSCDVSVNVRQVKGSDIYVSKKGSDATIQYSEKIHFFRALGVLLEQLKKGSDSFEITEEPQFTMNGPMFDVSQGNAVINVKSVKDFLKRMAIMGLNMLMLYCEDSYEVKEQPYFGYMRGKYSYDDMKECDDFADLFGIEMIPCIQTLAHLYEVLKWSVYYDTRDDQETLLVGSEKTYQIVEEYIRAASAPFRTKRIHIGMDEAWHLGMGQYFIKNGYKKKFDIMNDHMERVLEIVKKYDLVPMFWSDMYFRAASKHGDYYDLKGDFTQELVDTVPKGAQLVYWDYYHDDEEFYHEMIKRHRMFGSDPIFAGGIWTWTGYGANWGKTFNTTNPALTACKKEGIKEVFVTIWGDNGTESDVFTNLLGLQLYAEHGYAKELDEEKLKERFEFCTGCNYDDFINIKYLKEVPGVPQDNPNEANPCKYLMWQDILTGLADYNIKGLPLQEHYENLTLKLKDAISRNGDYSHIFELLYNVSNVLSIKAEAGLRITKAYKDGNKEELKRYVEVLLPELKDRVSDLRNVHKKVWFENNKALGWDILDMRYGSLLIRTQSAIEQIDDYLNGRVERIEELEQERLSFTGREGIITYGNFYGSIVSPSRIAPRG